MPWNNGYNPGAACGPGCGYCGACTKGAPPPPRCIECRRDYEPEDAFAAGVRHYNDACSPDCERKAYRRGTIDDGDLAARLHDADRDFTEPYEP